MNRRLICKRNLQLLVVLLGALALKQYYATAGVNQLRWILAPTTFLVGLVTGSQFEFESHAGYLSSDRSFLIAASCAGVNFLITAFLMLSLRKLWSEPNTAWRFIPAAACLAYLSTLVANTVRIATALHLRQTSLELGWLSGNQLHRFEGIFIYFGFLSLLFLLSERVSRSSGSKALNAAIPQFAGRPLPGSNKRTQRSVLLRQTLFPLVIYYATTLGLPVANAAYRRGPVSSDFWEHSVFVLLTPLLVLLPFALFRFIKDQRQHQVVSCWERGRPARK